jgi:flagellar L-ring protein precursor FlgH
MNRILIAALIAVLSGCTTNAVKVVEPTTARPQAQNTAPAGNGAIYQAASYRPLFEDRRARFVGDTLLVAISEKTSASNKTGNSNSRAASAQMAVPTVQGLPVKSLQGINAQASVSTKSEDKDAATNDNLFSGTISVTVVEVLPNGNLLVSGEKQIGVNGETDTIRFSGVVNPLTIQPGNVVSSVQVADARVESVSRSTVDPARVAGFLARFFMSFIPFR